LHRHRLRRPFYQCHPLLRENQFRLLRLLRPLRLHNGDQEYSKAHEWLQSDYVKYEARELLPSGCECDYGDKRRLFCLHHSGHVRHVYVVHEWSQNGYVKYAVHELLLSDDDGLYIQGRQLQWSRWNRLVQLGT
jgi:hypothetical protein